MGKTKRNKAKRKEAQPTGLASVKEFETQNCRQTVEEPTLSAVTNLVEKLQSPSADERECTCCTIANLVSQPTIIRQFIKAGMVRVAGPLLVDPSLGVRQAALGALRNMTVDGGLDVCIMMVEQDIMTPLTTLLLQFGPEWTCQTKDGTETEVFLQALHLMWNICEVSPTAVKIINQQNLLPVLLPCLLPGNHGYPIAVTAAQCLYTLTEDNTDTAEMLSRPTELQELMGLLKDKPEGVEQMLHQVLVAGILYNISSGQLDSLGGSVIGQVTDLLVSVLQLDITGQLAKVAEFLRGLQSQSKPSNPDSITDGSEDMLADLASSSVSSQEQCLNSSPCGSTGEDLEEGDIVEQESTTRPGLAGHPLEIKHKALDAMVTKTQALITAQQVCMEMAANLCCIDDEECEDMEGSDSSSDDLTVPDIPEDIMDQEDMEQNTSLCLPEVQKAFVNSDIIHQVFQKLKVLDPGITETLNEDSQCKRLKNSFSSLQSRALLCTGNLVSALEPTDLGGLDSLHGLWSLLTQMAGLAASADDVDCLEGVTGAMGAVIERLADLDSTRLQVMSDSDVQFLYKLGTQCCHQQVRANTIRIVSALACHLVDKEVFSLLKGIGEFLFHIASTDTELWVVAESLDAIFDVFADDKTDPVVKELGLIGKLKEITPALKTKVQQQKNHSGEHYPIISTAKSNLLRFIKYKSSRSSAV